MKRFLVALQFLTILPVKIRSKIAEKDFGGSLLYFPVIGMLIGLLLCLTAFLLGFLPYPVMCAGILIMSIAITGGIHLDGFADTCDGFYGSKPKEKILEIMRDSRIGVMGMIGIACLLLLKFTLIISLSKEVLWRALIMMCVFARWSQVMACCAAEYARKEGKAKYFIEHAGRKELFIGAFFTLALFLLLMKCNGVILFVLSLLFVFLFMSYIKRRIGGMTGDTIGAVSEVAEVAVLLFTLISSGTQCLY